MIIKPIIPIWLMAIICCGLLALKRRGIVPYIRQIIIVILLFVINLRIMLPNGKVEVQSRKLDTYVLFVIDDTLSMKARDYDGQQERMVGVRRDCEHIVEELRGARFAVISFDNKAKYLSPYTDNGRHVMNVINAMKPVEVTYAQGTSLNVCRQTMEGVLQTAFNRGDGKVVVFFFSDGEITGKDSLESFRSMDSYVDGGAVLGYGTETGGKMYVEDYNGEGEILLQDTSEWPYVDAVSRIDESNLERIAADLGVEYYHMTGDSQLDSLLRDIRDAARADTTTEVSRGYSDIYYFFVIPLALLLVCEVIDYKRKG